MPRFEKAKAVCLARAYATPKVQHAPIGLSRTCFSRQSHSEWLHVATYSEGTTIGDAHSCWCNNGANASETKLRDNLLRENSATQSSGKGPWRIQLMDRDTHCRGIVSQSFATPVKASLVPWPCGEVESIVLLDDEDDDSSMIEFRRRNDNIGIDVPRQ
eukprot:scaffold801_cov170-Amphora_coffeaeformis.AAC.9